MFMLVWLENHLIVLGLVAIVVGLGLGAVLGRARREASDSPRPAVSSGLGGSRTTGAGRASARYQTRSW
jgi:hypothetical protein